MSHMIDFSGYKRDSTMSKGVAAADLLDWAAQRYPRVWVTVGHLFALAHGLSRIPNDDEPHVEKFRKGTLGTASVVLRKQYRRYLLRSSMGARATVDADDAAVHNCHHRAVMGMARAAENLHDVTRIIEVDRLSDSEEMRPHRAYMDKVVKPMIEQVANPVIRAGLVPPRRFSLLPMKSQSVVAIGEGKRKGSA